MSAKQVPDTTEFLALQAKTQLALGVGLLRVTFRLPDATVPDDHITRAIVAFRDSALEIGVVQRVILDVHGQAPHLRVQ
ncbi:hypothetical protein D3C79_1038160 [compost metagenome]